MNAAEFHTRLLHAATLVGVDLDELSALAGRSLIRDELATGRKLLSLGADPIWVCPSDWDTSPSPIITYDDNECRIVAVVAAHPGSGAFSRLVDAIRKSNRVPVVVEPMGYAMPSILARWGWLKSVGPDGESEWRPA